jgi:predicted acyltransferase
MQERNQSLDALRGFAILAMVLSSSIAFGILPAWMYHAQEPPPSHAFIPTHPGISWVDLVFPFFLFSMGAAIPLALHNKIKNGISFSAVFFIAAKRFVLLTFFALFTLHARAGIMSSSPQVFHYLLSIAAFVLIFFQFCNPFGPAFKKTGIVLQVLAFLLAIIIMYVLPYKDGKGFSLYKSDIIIIVLANMAFFGTLAWWLTRQTVWARLLILPFVMAVFLSGTVVGTWMEIFFNWSPAPWMYKFYYLKYLFIIIPGTLAGEWMLKDGENTGQEKGMNNKIQSRWLPVLCLGIVILNVVCLFYRYLLIDLFCSIAIIAALHFILKTKEVRDMKMMKHFFTAGAYLLLLGLFFEGFEGGIKKDPSTYSYYFITAGLAFFMLLIFNGLQVATSMKHVIDFLAMNGRNPMLAYVTGNLLLIPLLHLSGTMPAFMAMDHNVITGFIKGCMFTGIVSMVTVFTVKKKWFWKT